jgi:hypothetical protein
MQELMSRHKAYSLSPRDCLKTTLFQKWQRMVAPPGKRGTILLLNHSLARDIFSFLIEFHFHVVLIVLYAFPIHKHFNDNWTVNESYKSLMGKIIFIIFIKNCFIAGRIMTFMKQNKNIYDAFARTNNNLS